MNHLPLAAHHWSIDQKIRYLENHAAAEDRAAVSDREWPHHRAQARRVAAEMRAQIQELKAC